MGQVSWACFFVADDLSRAPLMTLIENRPNERDRHGLDPFPDEEPAGGAHVVFVQRRLDRPVGDHALAPKANVA